MSQNQFDVDCLRHIVADADVRQISLAAAMIKLHALSIARHAPSLRDDALEIVKYAQQLYAGLPDKSSIGRVLQDHPASARLGRGALDDLVDAIWDHVRRGRR